MLVTRLERPPIPTRAFDWLAYDADQDVCADPECSCRTHVVQGWGATEHEAIVEWTRELLDRTDAPMPIIEDHALGVRADVPEWLREPWNEEDLW